jgi:hypothetical protein
VPGLSLEQCAPTWLASRRNRNFKIIRSAGPGLFITEMREMQPDAMATLRREAACYEMARNDPALSRLMSRLGAALGVTALLQTGPNSLVGDAGGGPNGLRSLISAESF